MREREWSAEVKPSTGIRPFVVLRFDESCRLHRLIFDTENTEEAQRATEEINSINSIRILSLWLSVPPLCVFESTATNVC
jgi:hypothetical protein